MKVNRLTATQQGILVRALIGREEELEGYNLAEARAIMEDVPNIDFAVTEGNVRSVYKLLGIDWARARPRRRASSLETRVAELEEKVAYLCKALGED